MTGISVVICCYNSSTRLKETLEGLSRQSLNGIPWEIVLVDNGSTDGTIDVAINEWNKYAKHEVKLIIVKESRQGLSFARESGIIKAQHELILFCDDDNWLDDHYLEIAHQIMTDNPGVGGLGGHNIGVCDSGKFPEWWDEYQQGYAVGRQAEHNGILTHRMYLWGAGLVSRKSLLLKTFDGRYPSLLKDRSGNELSSGGDSEICARILLLGYSLYYDDRLKLKHYMTNDRLQLKYRERLFDGHTKSLSVLREYHDVIVYNSMSFFTKLGIVLESLCFILAISLKISGRGKQQYYNNLYKIFNWNAIPASATVRGIVEFKDFSVNQKKK
jgi:glycosyltransferase involved in cell wall biosynthesis